jgi:hypothetical protein
MLPEKNADAELAQAHRSMSLRKLRRLNGTGTSGVL